MLAIAPYLAELLVLPLLEDVESGHWLDGGAGLVKEGGALVIRVTRGDPVDGLPGLSLRSHILDAIKLRPILITRGQVEVDITL